MSFRRSAGARRARRQDGLDFDPKHARKLQQLCRQVERALSYVLPGQMRDPLLADVMVESVSGAPDASRLLVQLTTSRPPEEAPQILERLERVRGYLRGEVATAITRKRAPELLFHLAAPSGEVQP